jgi:hypothetical protein
MIFKTIESLKSLLRNLSRLFHLIKKARSLDVLIYQLLRAYNIFLNKKGVFLQF